MVASKMRVDSTKKVPLLLYPCSVQVEHDGLGGFLGIADIRHEGGEPFISNNESLQGEVGVVHDMPCCRDAELFVQSLRPKLTSCHL